MIFSRFRAVAFVIALFGVANLSAQTALVDSLTSNLNIEGLETTFDPETGLATANGDVRISYGDAEIRSGSASYNANTGEVIARDNVVIWKAGVTYKGEMIIYNANTGEISGDAIRSSMPFGAGTIFYETDNIRTESKLIDKVEGEASYFTSHDSANPNFRMRARSLTIYPDDRVVMRNMTLLLGNTPVLYFPYYSQSLQEDVGYRFTPGYTSGWGAFLLNQYGVIHGDHTLAKYRLDLRSQRGVAVGVDFISLRHKANKNNFGTLKLYGLHDLDPTTSRSGGPRFRVPDNRYRVNFQHRVYLPGPDESTWYLDFDINKLSDIHFYEDFFFNDFRENPEPDNQISLVHTDPAYVATLMTRLQFNSFYRVGEKLPELSVDFTRRPLWNTGIFHQGSFSIGVLREQLGSLQEQEFNRLVAQGQLGFPNPLDRTAYQRFLGLAPGGVLFPTFDTPSFTRIHTYQEFLYPTTLFGWLNLVPRIGGGVTHYSDIDGSPTGLSSDTKGIFHVGLDASFKLVKTWNDFQKPSWGLDGLRHIFQPYLNYSYLDANQPDGFPSIDRLSATTRPRSLDVPFFAAVDDLRSWNVARVGVRNLLQTRRDYQVYDNGQVPTVSDDATQAYTWAGLNTYVDVFMTDPEFNRNISNLYNELFWRPVPWIQFWLDSQIPLAGRDRGGFSELNHGITFMPVKSLHLTVGHQYLSDHPFFRESSLLFSRIYARLSDNWGLAMNHVYEIDDGTLEFQSYSITRDLTSWVASVGAMIRDNRNGLKEYGILLSFTLKDFPQLSIPLDIDPNPTGRGGSNP